MSLSITGLRVELGGRAVVDGVSFTASAGSVTALVGPNGAGKSTVLRAALGLVPSRGDLRQDGEDLRRMDPRQRARRLAWVPQRSRLALGLSVANVVAMGRFAHQGALARLSAADQAAVDAALAEADATALAPRAFDTLSCGEQQRVLVARALATGAQAVLLDEPTAALDLAHALGLLAILRRLAQAGRAVVAVLHDLREVHGVADRCVVMAAGRQVADGPPAEVLDAGRLSTVWGVIAEPGGCEGYRLAGGGR